MNQLQIFNHPIFGDVRTWKEEDGSITFCAPDATRALGYKDSVNAIKTHCKRDGVAFHHLTDSLGRSQETKFISRGNLLRLAANSKLSGAEAFESWIFDDVVPTVMEHGAYLTPDKIEEVLDNPDTIIVLATKLKEARAEKDKLALENAQQKQLIAEYEPKVQYVDKILASTGTLAATQIAADYGLSAQKLNKILHDEHVQYKVNGQWLLYAAHRDMGYTKSQPIPIVRSDGRDDFQLHTQWTQKGRLFIHNLLQRRGIQAIIDRDPAGAQQVI